MSSGLWGNHERNNSCDLQTNGRDDYNKLRCRCDPRMKQIHAIMNFMIFKGSSKQHTHAITWEERWYTESETRIAQLKLDGIIDHS